MIRLVLAPLTFAPLVFALLASSNSANAATFYVANTGVDSNTCGSVSAPCKSFKRVLRTSTGAMRVGPGDQILLKGGRYVVNYPLHDQFSIENFVPNRANCTSPNSLNSLSIKVDPQAQEDVVIEMGETFADPAFNASKRGTLMRILQSNCVIINGKTAVGTGTAKRLILDGKERKFGLSNGFYDAYFDPSGSYIPPANTPQPPSAGLLSLVDYSGKTETLPTTDLIYGGITIRDVEVRNTLGVGIGLNKYRDVKISNNHVHHTFFRAIGGYGYNVTLENNQINNAAQINRNNVMFYARQDSGGWPGVMQMGGDYEFKNLHDRSGNVVMRNNQISNSWGEGIINGSDGGQITGNTVFNTYSVGIYLERSSNMLVDKNYVYANDALYHRPIAATPYIPASSTPDNFRRPFDGITLASESSSATGSLVHDLKIVNNLLNATRRAFTYWYDSSNPDSNNSYSNINFSHNTLIASKGDYPIRIFSLGSGVNQYPNNKMMNNLIENSPSTGAGWNIGNSNLWTLDGNFQFAAGNYSYVRLVGPTVTAGSPPANFALDATSPALAINTADSNVTSVTTDWLSVTRHALTPTVGVFEKLSSSIEPR